MGKWWIIPEEIIGRFFEKWKERDGITIFNGNALTTTIQKFIKTELQNLDQNLHRKYIEVKKRPSSDSLKRAINARSLPGVFIQTEKDKDKLDLICYYAVGKNWLDALEEQSIKETDILKLNRKQTEKIPYKIFSKRSSPSSDAAVDTLVLNIIKCDSSSLNKAEQFYNTGLEIAERTKNEFSRAKLNGVYGVLLTINEVKLPFARQILKDSLDFAKTKGLTEDQLPILWQLNTIELKIGDLELAGIYTEDYLNIALAKGMVLNEARAYSMFGLIESLKKEDLKSMSFYQMAIRTTKRIQFKISKDDELERRHILKNCYRKLAKIADIKGDIDQARKYLLLALENCDELTAEYASIQLELVGKELHVGIDTTLKKLSKSMRDDKDHPILKDSKSDFWSWFISYIKLIAKCCPKDELDFMFRVGYSFVPDFKSQKGAERFLVLYGEYFIENKKYDEAEKILLEALELLSTSAKIDVYSHLISVYHYKNDESSKNKYISHSIQILEDSLNETNFEYKKAEYFFILAQLYILKKDVRTALNFLNKIEKIYKSSEDIPTLELANTLLSLSWCHRDLGNSEKFLDYSLNVIELVNGTDLHKIELEARINCCNFYHKKKKIETAIKFLVEADYLNKKYQLNQSDEISYWRKLLEAEGKKI